MSDPCKLFEGLHLDVDDPIEQRLRYNALKNCIPLNVTMELTQECNFHCTHCYNFDRTQSSTNPHKENSLSLAKWKDIIDQVRDMGCFYICFTGGETLTVPFLDELISYAKEKGAAVRIKTNGSLLTKNRAKKLKELGVSDIEFSLYGGTQETHDNFTQTKGHFKKVLDSLVWAKSSELNPICNIILHRDSIGEFSKMILLLKEREIPHQVSTEISVRHDGSRGSLDYRASVKDLESLFTSEDGRELLPHENTTGNIQCACARSNCGIGFDGSVYPCIGAPILAGTLKDQSFKFIWQNSPVFKRIRGLESKDYEDCHHCDDRNFCQRSSGLVFNNTGKYTGSEKHSCETAAMIKKLNLK